MRSYAKKESLLDKLSVKQALEFFVKVVQVACDRSKPVAIIFDGLDETSRNHLKTTTTIFSGLFTKLERYNAEGVHLESDRRRDHEAVLWFTPDRLATRHLDTSGSKKDVETYLRRNLEDIVTTWVLDWNQWPGEERFQKLCDQAGGLFIWAVTDMFSSP